MGRLSGQMISTNSSVPAAETPTAPAHHAIHARLAEQVARCRALDERLVLLAQQGRGGPHPSSAGHELLMGITLQLGPDDAVFPYYRSLHHLVGRGMSTAQVARDFLYREGSSSGGRSHAAHAGSAALGIFPTAGPTASQCLPATGVAWAQQLDGRGAVTLCSIGEGATRSGEFLEALAFALERRLPLLFLVEDNGYAISTRTAETSALALGLVHEGSFAPGCFAVVDGADADRVLTAGEEVLDRLRAGGGPALLWCRVPRLHGHTSQEDQGQYRAQEELAALVDPLRNLLPDGVQEAAREQVRLEVRRVAAESEPAPATAGRHLVGPPVAHRPLPALPAPETLVEATRAVLGAGLAAFPALRLLGQDIEDPKGGVMGLTQGLSTTFPDRVQNAPIAESTIIGAAIGLATRGHRPVFEIQFADFLPSGFNQLVNNAVSLRWRADGSWTCPLVLYAPYGGYIPRAAAWHSQSNEAWWTHTPGLRVAVPATPADLVGLFWSAFQDEEISLVLIPRALMRGRHTVGALQPVPFGRARRVLSGDDVTVVCWGNAVALAAAAAEQLARHGVGVDLLDLRSLAPWDQAAVEASLARTGRLVVVQEDARTASFGATVVTEMVSRAERFELLLAPPELVSRGDTLISYQPAAMEAVLPQADDIVAAVRRTIAYTEGDHVLGA